MISDLQNRLVETEVHYLVLFFYLVEYNGIIIKNKKTVLKVDGGDAMRAA